MSKRNLILWSLILVKFLLQYFLINPVYELQRDEFLHIDLGKHLAWGYTSVPPVTGLVSFVILLLGNSVFWIKFFPALFGALTTYVVWKIIEELKGGTFALVLGALATIFSVLVRLNILYQPNSMDVLCWTLLYYTLIKYVNNGQKKWLFAAAVVFAVGFLNKYNIMFMVMGLIPAILLTPCRAWFQKKELYIAVFIALVLITPNLIWQYLNHFPVLHHMEELRRTQLVNVDRIDFLKEQFFFFIGSTFILIASVVSFFLYPPFRKYRFVLLTLVFTLTIFTYFRAKGYYAIGLYPAFLAFGVVYLEHLLRKGWVIYLRPVAFLLPVLVFIPYAKDSMPIYTPQQIIEKQGSTPGKGAYRWEDGKQHLLPQDYADMLGWRELAEKVDRVYARLPDQSHTIVLCDNYGEAGAINFYSRYKNISAVSFNADYKYWFNLNREIYNVISVKEADNTEANEKEKQVFFHTISWEGEITNPYAREKGTYIRLMSNPRISIRKVILHEIAIK